MDISIHNVEKIEMSKTRKVSNFYVRDVTFYALEYCLELGDYVKVERKISLFLEDKDAGKVKYA
tara:strand:- start:137 stop:328 length:192 start_codon:yes stop_codon:yes gene_type:complete